MGLGIVELGIRIEEEFGVSIEDADYERLRSLRDLQRYLEWKLGRTGSNGWPLYDLALVRGFCRIRREIVRQTGISRSRLRPSTRLGTHWPSRQDWNDVREPLFAVLEVPLPSGEVEGWIAGGCLAILMSPLLAIACLHWDLPFAVWLPSFIVLCGGIGAVQSYRRAEAEFRSMNLGNVARTSCYALSQEEARNALDGSLPAAQVEVMPRLLAIVSEVASVPIEEIRPDSRFVDDLMMG